VKFLLSNRTKQK